MTERLRIAELPVGPNGGLIGITFAPGKHQVGAMSGNHRRNLAEDLEVIRNWGASAVVCLVTADELVDLKISTLGDEVSIRFMEFHHLPIQDYHAPDEIFEQNWPEASRRLRTLILSGNRILIHCKGGLGRAGTVAARLLVELGASPEQAIQDVRSARSPMAIETDEQEAWVRKGGRVWDSIATSPEALRDRALGTFLGLAVGDAVGTTLEFSPKPETPILSEMVGGGPFELPAGAWTDDTSMSLALAESLIAHPNFDPADLMARFLSWYRSGSYSHSGDCFDIGNATAQALRSYERTGSPFSGSTDPYSAGNGSIMRLAPVAVRHWADRPRLIRIARDQSRTTHGAAEAVDCCEILAELLADAIAGRSLPDLLKTSAAGKVRGFRLSQPREEVRGTGYVVASLHAALWAVSRTSTFRGAVLLAANLGEDADTTAAVTGQIAGAIYGLSGIPAAWLDRLIWRDEIQHKAETLFEAGLSRV